MNNFIFENKTKVYFGKGGVKEYLGSLLVNYGETVMLAYGGGSIKRNGVYDEIMDILNRKGVFLLKGSVSYVAKELHSSEASIYRYLGKLNNKD